MPSRVPALLMALLLAGCGELDDAPFLPARIEGLLSGVDPAFAVVAVRDAGISVQPDATGHFVLEGIAPGSATLFVVASEQAGALIDVRVRGGELTDLGQLTLEPTAKIILELEAPSAQRLDLAQVTVNGVPAHVTPTSEEGEAMVGPLPAGCYQLGVQTPGFERLQASLCLARGERREVGLRLPEPDGTSTLGCAATGCLAGYSCERSTGRCHD